MLLSLFNLALSVASLILVLFVRRSYGKTIESYRKSVATYKRALEADAQVIASQRKLIEALTQPDPQQKLN
jgi:hypothetical protein